MESRLSGRLFLLGVPPIHCVLDVGSTAISFDEQKDVANTPIANKLSSDMLSALSFKLICF